MSARPVEHEHARDGAEFVEGGGDQSLYVFRVADCAVAPTDDSQWGTPFVVVLRDGVMAATGVLEVEEHLHSYPDLDGDGVAELVILRGQVSAKLGPSLSVASFHNGSLVRRYATKPSPACVPPTATRLCFESSVSFERVEGVTTIVEEHRERATTGRFPEPDYARVGELRSVLTPLRP